MSYFCEDSNNSTFGESEAKVFCKMLGWPMGKKVSVPGLTSFSNQQSNLYGSSYLFSTVSCKGDELHIMECENTFVSMVSVMES